VPPLTSGLLVSGLMIFAYLIVKQLKTDIFTFISLLPFISVAFLQLCPPFVAGIAAALLSIANNLAPLEKIVTQFRFTRSLLL